jgi:hypothetical protein
MDSVESMNKWLKEKKAQLDLDYPKYRINHLPIGYLKKIGHIMEIPSYGVKKNQELVADIFNLQDRDNPFIIINIKGDYVFNKSVYIWGYFMKGKKYRS